MGFSDFTVKEEFVKLFPLNDHTRGQDIFNAFLKFVKESNLPLSKLVAITTDGTPSMTGKHNGFLALCAKDELRKISKEVGLEINAEKTRYMLLSRLQNAGQNNYIKIGNRCFKMCYI
jgi:hypothetical protein